MTLKMDDESENNASAIALQPTRGTSLPGNNRYDVTDIPPKNAKVSNLDIFFLLFSITTHIMDIFLDVNLVVQYYIHNKFDKFGYTISMILIPSFIVTIINAKMNQYDAQKEQKNKQEIKCSFLCKIRDVIFFILTVLFQMTMTRRCLKNLTFAIKSRKYEKSGDKVAQQRNFIKMLKGEEDIALLRVLECFIETAPQQILQLSLFIHEYHGEFSILSLHQAMNIVSSFVLMAWSMASYHQSIRLPQWDKKNITLSGTIIQFLWHFFITISRIACVCAVAVYSEFCILGAAFLHWFVMTIWIVAQSKGVIMFCRNPNKAPHMPLSLFERISSILFSGVLGLVYIFIYLNPEDGGTYCRHLFYYSICFIENITACILILTTQPSEVITLWYQYSIAVCCVVPYILGVLSMIVYYLRFHPSMKHLKFSYIKQLKI